jgi:F-type H+-transporting ATPase subunit delta
MAENFTIARPYAKAVFEQATAENRVNEWEKILQILAAVADNAQVAALLNDPRLSAAQWVELLFAAVAKQQPGLNEAQKKEVQNFLNILAAAKRIAVLPEILQRYQQLTAAARALKEVTITSACPLEETQRDRLTQALTRRLQSKVTVDFQEDPELIGGLVIRCGNWVMDDSIKGKLQLMQDSWR